MRRAARTDANQTKVVIALREMGATVQHLHWLGQGTPDLLVGYGGHNLLFEIKDGSQPPSRRQLTLSEKEWHQHWRGQVSIISSIQEALNVLNHLDGAS